MNVSWLRWALLWHLERMPDLFVEEIRHALQVPEQGPAQPRNVHVHHHRGLPDPPRRSVLERSQRVNR